MMFRKNSFCWSKVVASKSCTTMVAPYFLKEEMRKSPVCLWAGVLGMRGPNFTCFSVNQNAESLLITGTLTDRSGFSICDLSFLPPQEKRKVHMIKRQGNRSIEERIFELKRPKNTIICDKLKKTYLCATSE